MRYRATLSNVDGLPRPVQDFSPSLEQSRAWAKGTIERYQSQHPTATVTIFQQVEVAIETISAEVPTPNKGQ